MIVLGILDVLYWLVTAVGNIVLPALPTSITTVLTYIFNLVDNGLDFVFAVCFDKQIVADIASWFMTTFVALFAFDIVWAIIQKIKLSHDHQEEG